MALRWYSVVVDSHDIAAQARWWAEVLDFVIVYEDEHEVAVIPKHLSVDPITDAKEWMHQPQGLVFVPVPEGKTVKNRLHIDLRPHGCDQATELERLLSLGARRIDIGQGEQTWVVLADPEGNELCLLRGRADEPEG